MDIRTDTSPFHRRCSAYYAGSANNTSLRRSSSDQSINAARLLLRSGDTGGRYRWISAAGAQAAARLLLLSIDGTDRQTDGHRTVT